MGILSAFLEATNEDTPIQVISEGSGPGASALKFNLARGFLVVRSGDGGRAAGDGHGGGYLAFTRNEGFTEAHLNALVAAYAAALASPPPPRPPSLGWSILGRAPMFGAGNLGQALPPGGWAEDESGGGGGGEGLDAQLRPGSSHAEGPANKSGPSMSKAQALKALSELGLVVYQPHEDDADWDSLAG